jgi:hypothetical protein
VAVIPECDGDDGDEACNAVDKYLSQFSDKVTGTTNDKIVTRIVDRTFRADGSRFEIIV